MARKKAKKKSKRRKSSKTSKTRTRKRTDLDVLKEQADQLYPRVRDNLEVVLKQTGMDSEELAQTIQKYGYDAIPTLDGFNIAEPIWNQMLKTFKLYDKVQGLVERLDNARNKLFITELEKKTVAMEAEIKNIEDEETFYSEKGVDKEGMVKMKEKWYAEKEHWEFKKSEIVAKLENDQENEKLLADLAQAELQLKILKGKRNKVRMQNVQPTIAKWSQKIGKGVATIQDSIGEITKPFAEMGDMSGYGNKKGTKEHDYASDWTTDKIFGSKKSKKGGYDIGSGF